MSHAIMVVNPYHSEEYMPPPWSLLNNEGLVTLDCVVHVDRGDIVMVLGQRFKDDSLVKVYHPASGRHGYLELGLLIPLEE